MEENTAFSIGREWLGRTRKSKDRLGALADTLRRVVDQPVTWAWTPDNRRLMLLDDKGHVWIATIEFEPKDQFDEMTKVNVECLDLRDEPPRLSLTETHTLDEQDKPQIAYNWRLELGRLAEPLEFGAIGPYVYGRQSDDPAVVFGWRLAEAIGWTKRA